MKNLSALRPWFFMVVVLLVASKVLCQETTDSKGTSDSFNLIVQVKTLRDILKFKAMCQPSPVAFKIAAKAMGLPEDCHMPGAYRRLFTNAIFGFAGEFTDAQQAQLSRCLPSAVYHQELDGRVYKAEDTQYKHPFTTSVPARRRVSSRRLQQEMQAQTDVFEKVREFDDMSGTGVDGTPIDLRGLSSSTPLNASGIKDQTLPPVLWNLDRIDQRTLPLDRKYLYGDDVSTGIGEGATIYVVDSGIYKDHQEFVSLDGSGSRASYGYDFVEDDEIAADCDGHGTHVAGTAAGVQVGVAKGARIVAVRILDCDGSGTISDTVAALDWVAAHAQKPSVVTLSLGIQVGSWSRVLEEAVRSLTTNYGITVVVASGNSAVDACYVAPANVPEVITVAASNLKTKLDQTHENDSEDVYKWSNSGPCLDVWAPGVDILSACGSDRRCANVSPDAYAFASGTSMAAPLVAGTCAVALGKQPDLRPADLSAMIVAAATPGRITKTDFKPGTPNRLLYSRLGSSAAVSASDGPGVQLVNNDEKP